jgi:hypothetical protein
MFTFGFFVRVCLTSLVSAWFLSACIDLFNDEETLLEAIAHWISVILAFVACGGIVISAFGMIWTF